MAIRTPTPAGRPPTSTTQPRQEVFGIPVGGTGSLQGNVESLHRQLNDLMGGGVGNAVGSLKSAAQENAPTLAGGAIGGLLGAGLGAAGQRGGLDPVGRFASAAGKRAGQFFLPAFMGKGSGKDTGGESGAGAIGSVATPEAAPAAPPVDDMALQMFFTNTIAPYLEQLRASMAGTTGGVANQMQGMVGQVPANMRSLFNPQQQAGQANSLATALAAATAAGPTLDQLMSQIQEAANMQRFAAYQAMKQQAGLDTANALGGIKSLLGLGETEAGGDLEAQLNEEANKAKKGG